VNARILLVQNFITEYRKPLFELMARRWDIRFLFYSDGGEWYWRGPVLDIGDLPGRYLPGIWVGRTRVAPGLIAELARQPFDVLIAIEIGKFTLPMSFAAAKLRRRPFILWAGIWKEPGGLLRRLARPMTRRIYQGADAIVTYGRHVSGHLVEQGVDPSKLFVAPQSVDPSRFPYGWSPIEPDTVQSIGHLRVRGPVVAFIGRLEPQKGPQLLVRAIARLKATGTRVNALLVGDGEMRPQLERMARDLEVQDDVQFAGRVPNDDLRAVYRSAGACVIPSLITQSFAEPWSMVANEAMLVGCPVIASTSVGAVRDGLLRDSETGVVFEEGDVPGLAEAIRSLVGDPETSRKISQAGREAVSEYSYERAVEGFEQAIEFATSGRRRP
jgi:glycosyltransferase involved in cell wall biosynthesis